MEKALYKFQLLLLLNQSVFTISPIQPTTVMKVYLILKVGISFVSFLILMLNLIQQ